MRADLTYCDFLVVAPLNLEITGYSGGSSLFGVEPGGGHN
jgi:hypothetical protein